MPSAQALWKEKKKNFVLYIEPLLLRLQPTKAITTLTANPEIETESAALISGEAHGNGSNGCVGDVGTLCEQGGLKELPGVLHFMDQRGIWGDSYDYGSLLQRCLDLKALPEGKLVHAHIIQTGFKPSISVGTKLVIMYAKCGSLADARRVLEEMPERNVVSWTAIIAECARQGHGEEALAFFYQMQPTGVQPNEFTFASVLPACANLAALRQGKEIHGGIIRSGFQFNAFVGTALISMYAKCRRIESARQVFGKMPERNVFLWTSLIAGYAQNEQIDEAAMLFQKMPERNVVSWNAMIAGFAQNGRVDQALKLFQRMSERDVVSWNVMVAGYAQFGFVDDALELFRTMPRRDIISWNAMIAGYAQNSHFGEALGFFQKMPERNDISWNAMIAAYAHGGHFEEALVFFEKMPKQDVVSWNGLIAGYVQNGHFDEALKVFKQMHLTGMKPNLLTFVSILPACANLAALEHGKKIHEDIIRNKFQSDILVGNALVDMYAKCGSLQDACHVFDKMPERNVVSWTTMIVGYAMHGSGKDALQLFKQMQHSGTSPNHITFVGVLSACGHVGLVDDGWQYFYCMSRDYQITPSMEHYCCMVDLLGRAGRLDEAQDFINKMPIKPNAAVWGSLLGACRTHANIELGERVADYLFKADPESSAHYVLLSNIYAAAGRWDDKEKVRKMMKDRKINKTPGRSWIEVNNEVYSFFVEDRSHPQTHKIYAMLERLSGQMKEAGYVPDTNFVLHDVEEQQKEHILCHHSEKLAVAFGLINTVPGTSIRVVKNLRVCGDCHSAIKFISKIIAREIVVRDVNRFHLFKGGQCSCGDYW